MEVQITILIEQLNPLLHTFSFCGDKINLLTTLSLDGCGNTQKNIYIYIKF